MTLNQILDLKNKIRKISHKNKQLAYDLSRMEYLLAECMELKRADLKGDSFTSLWCDTLLSDIRKTLDLPRFGVDEKETKNESE